MVSRQLFFTSSRFFCFFVFLSYYLHLGYSFMYTFLHYGMYLCLMTSYIHKLPHRSRMKCFFSWLYAYLLCLYVRTTESLTQNMIYKLPKKNLCIESLRGIIAFIQFYTRNVDDHVYWKFWFRCYTRNETKILASVTLMFRSSTVIRRHSKLFCSQD